ncbi:hypothetical protein T492DRAFT_1130666 [Pavlovales sp. CCMP2436]|nr:hypothetical protein T492DRAFT_1130666 [Pavlovales sp. CCMP2436]
MLRLTDFPAKVLLRPKRRQEMLRLTDLPAEAIESALALAAPQDIASALRSCRSLPRLDPWRSAFDARWGAPGVELRASVGKMTYLLRDVCELVSGDSALAKAWHGACQRALDTDAMERFGDEDDEDDSKFELELQQRYITHSPDQARARSETSAWLSRGLYVLLDRTNKVGDLPFGDDMYLSNDWHVKRFVLASPRGDLVAFYSTEMGTYQEETYESRMWALHATVIGVVDEPRLTEAMGGSHGLRGPQLLSWFDGLLLGGDPHLLKTAQHRRRAAACGSASSAARCQSIVGSLLDSLGLGEGAVHPDDLLLALLVISNVVPADRVAEIWGAPPGDRGWEDDNDHVRMHPGVCLWGSCCSPGASPDTTNECLEWDGAPTRMTWAGAASS